MLGRFVYVIHAESTESYKIGISTSPTDRLKQIQANSPASLILLHSKEVSNARDVEIHIHTTYAVKRIHSEWFQLKQEEVQAIIAYIDDEHSVQCAETAPRVRCIYGCTAVLAEYVYIPFSLFCTTHNCAMYE